MKISLLSDNYFHVYNRGVEKRKIFLDKNDYERFLILLYLCNSNAPVNVRDLFDKGLTIKEILSLKRTKTLVNIGAYCLMQNHVHLLIKTKTDKEASLFMQKLFTGYTMFFNKKYDRSGSLFESSFKIKLLDSDIYLKYILAYIHLNPIKLVDPLWKDKGIKKRKEIRNFLENYNWSSYQFYNKKVQEDTILSVKEFPQYFDNKKDFDDFIKDWLSFPEV